MRRFIGRSGFAVGSPAGFVLRTSFAAYGQPIAESPCVMHGSALLLDLRKGNEARRMNGESMQITDLRLAMDNAHAAIIAHKKESETRLNELLAEHARCAREYALATESSLDIEKIRGAESVISIRGKMGERIDGAGNFVAMGRGDDLSAVEQAIRWMACSYEPTSYTDLNSVFFGCKNYDRWEHQREDCLYRYGPRHGSIVFAIELREEHRFKGLSEQQRSDCIYYLEALKAGKLRVPAPKVAA